MLGPPVKHEGSSANHDYDMKKGLLTPRHVLDVRIQSSGEPPLIPRPPTQASPSLMHPHGGWLIEDDISSKAQLNIRPTAPVNVKFEKHQPQLKSLSQSMQISASNALFSQASQGKVEEVCQWNYIYSCFP